MNWMRSCGVGALVILGSLGLRFGYLATRNADMFQFMWSVPFSPTIWNEGETRGNWWLEYQRPFMLGNLITTVGLIGRDAEWIRVNLGKPSTRVVDPWDQGLAILEYSIGTVDMRHTAFVESTSERTGRFQICIKNEKCVGYSIGFGNGAGQRHWAEGVRPPS